MLGHFIFRLPGNMGSSLVIPIGDLTEDISALFLLISTDTHTGVDQDGMHDVEDNDDDNDAAINNIKNYESGYLVEKHPVKKIKSHE